MPPHVFSATHPSSESRAGTIGRPVGFAFFFVVVLQMGCVPWPTIVHDDETVCCECDRECFFEVEGTLSSPLRGNMDLFVVVRPIDPAATRYFVQFGDKSVRQTLWTAQVQLGSADFLPQSGERFEIQAVVLDTTVAGPPPVDPLSELSTTALPGLLRVSNVITVSVECGDCDSFESRLFRFLDGQQHPATGFLQSYADHEDLPVEFREFLKAHPGFLYDNSLAALAYLCRENADDLERARRILDAFLAIQVPGTGAFPDAVNVETLEALPPDYGTGNQMWAILALLKGYRVLGDSKYLDAAKAAGHFVLGQKNTDGYGGFTLFPGDTRVSTEHNADAYAAFSGLATELDAAGDTQAATAFRDAATHARIFVESRFDPKSGKTFTGTDETGVTTNTSPVPEDTQTWTLLSLGRSKWRRSYDWLLGPTGLWTTSASCPTLDDVPISGPSFSDADLSEVWVEGLAHVWVAANFLDELDNSRFDPFGPEATLRTLQAHAPHTDGSCLVAVCGTLDTGFGFSFFSACAVAPTAWAVFGALNANPFWDQSTAGGLASHPDSKLPWVALDVRPGEAFVCEAGDPCVFTVSGTSSGLADQPNLSIHVLIRPTDPSAGATFAQFPSATVESDGTWSASARLGSSEFPAESGDKMEVAAIVVDADLGTPPGVLEAITPDEIPGLIAVTGILSARVQVGS